MRYTAFHILCVLLLSLRLFAAPVGTVQIAAIDPAKGTVTILAGTTVSIIIVRPDTTISVNGQEAGFKDLQPGMTVKFRLADPGVAEEIDAAGVASPAATTSASAPPTGPAKFYDTKWSWPDPSIEGKKAWIILLPDLSVRLGWRKAIYAGRWQMIGDNTVIVHLPDDPAAVIIKFDPDLTQGSTQANAVLTRKK